MTVLALTALLFAGATAAGLVGALTGLGGGVVLVPLLTLGLGVDIKYAIGTALVAVIATSSGAAAAYVREGFSNVRIGLFFEIATTLRRAPRRVSRGPHADVRDRRHLRDRAPRLDGVLVEGPRRRDGEPDARSARDTARA